MLRLPRALVVFLLSIMLHPAGASDSKGSFAIKGAGSVDCARFLAAVDSSSSEIGQFVGWANGYLTRLNQMETDTFDILPWQTGQFLVVSLETHCRAHPSENFGAAVYSLARSLNGQRLTQSSPLREAQIGDETIALYEEVILRVQGKLRDLGFDPMDEDGRLGSGTQTALKGFQKRHGLAVTGQPDQATLLRLFYPPEAPTTP